MQEDFKKRKHEKYFYQAVSGAGLWGSLRSIFAVKKTVLKLRQKGWKTAEIERVQKIGLYGQRYWRWRNGDWTMEFWTEPSENDLKKWD